MNIFSRGIFSAHVMITILSLVMPFALASVSYGLPNMGHVTRDVTVFQKIFLKSTVNNKIKIREMSPI